MPPMLKRMLRHLSRSSFPARDRAMILLSIKAGLRACEIAALDWSMVLALQLHFSSTSESVDHHDSGVMDDGCND
jgi:site-specific recombinase XerC